MHKYCMRNAACSMGHAAAESNCNAGSARPLSSLPSFPDDGAGPFGVRPWRLIDPWSLRIDEGGPWNQVSRHDSPNLNRQTDRQSQVTRQHEKKSVGSAGSVGDRGVSAHRILARCSAGLDWRLLPSPPSKKTARGLAITTPDSRVGKSLLR